MVARGPHRPPMSLLPITPWQRTMVVLFGGVSLLVVLALAIDAPSPSGVVAATAYALKVALLLAPLALVRPGQWLHPLIFIGVWSFVIQAMPEGSLVISGMASHPGLPGVSTLRIAESVVIKLGMDCLAIVATYLGFYLARGAPALRLSHRAPRAIPLKLLIIAAVSVLALMVLVDAAGGLVALALQRGVAKDQRVLATIGGGHWHVMAAAVGPAVLVAGALMRRPLRSPIFLSALFVALAGKFIVTGSRGGTLAIAVLLFFIFASRQGQIKFGRTLTFVISVVVVIGVMTQFRYQSSKIESVREFQFEGGAYNLFNQAIGVFGRYSSSGNSDFPIYALVPHSTPLLLGESYLAVIAAPIPRALWTDKPMEIGRKAANTCMSFKEGGVPPTAAGEAFWNSHVVGVLFVFLTWGAFLRFVWKSVAASRMPGIIVIYIVTIYYLDPQTTAAIKSLQMIVPAWAALMFFCFRPFRGARSARSSPLS